MPGETKSLQEAKTLEGIVYRTRLEEAYQRMREMREHMDRAYDALMELERECDLDEEDVRIVRLHLYNARKMVAVVP